MLERLGLLALLDVADMTRNEIAAAFHDWVGAAWTVDPELVDETLAQLVGDRWIAVSSGGAAYSISRTGRDALGEWFATDPGETTPPREELVAKVLLSLASGRERALGVITRQRSSLTAALQARRQEVRRARHPREAIKGLRDLSPVLVEDARFARTEAELRWLDLCEARLNARRDWGGAA